MITPKNALISSNPTAAKFLHTQDLVSLLHNLNNIGVEEIYHKNLSMSDEILFGIKYQNEEKYLTCIIRFENTGDFKRVSLYGELTKEELKNNRLYSSDSFLKLLQTHQDNGKPVKTISVEASKKIEEINNINSISSQLFVNPKYNVSLAQPIISDMYSIICSNFNTKMFLSTNTFMKKAQQQTNKKKGINP